MLSDGGKRLRLNRLRNSHGYYFFLAADHQLSSGHIPQLASLQPLLRMMCECPDIRAVALNIGALKRIGVEFTGELILQAMGAPNPTGDGVRKVPLATVTDALRAGASMISVQVNFEDALFLGQVESQPTPYGCGSHGTSGTFYGELSRSAETRRAQVCSIRYVCIGIGRGCDQTQSSCGCL